MRGIFWLERRTSIPMAGEDGFLVDLRFRKCAFFLVRKGKNAGGKEAGRLCGTCFAVATSIDENDETQPNIEYAVTAAHVVNNTHTDQNLFIRVNTFDGRKKDIPAPVSSWKFHPHTDVAACPIDWPDDADAHKLDIMTIPVAHLPKSGDDSRLKIVEGEEVFIVGMLNKFPGSQRIQPIVRTGTIALMPHEKIGVNFRGGTEEVNAYLLEMISWAGLSGSPVIAYPQRDPRNPRSMDFLTPYIVLGLVHGALEEEEDAKVGRNRSIESIKLGMGIAVAIPGEDIYEVLMNNPDFRIHRAELLEHAKSEARKPIATPHSDEEPEPFRREHFEADLRKVTRLVEPSESDEETK